jgi:hypothetical protein
MTDRNGPCPCGSGKKFKKCHGAGGGGVTAAPAARTRGGSVAPAKAAPSAPAAAADEAPTADESIHIQRPLGATQREAARKRHLQRRAESPPLRGSLFFKVDS